MKSLDEAWRWFKQTKSQLQRFGRPGRRYWDDLDWDGSLGRDDELKNLEGEHIDATSRACLVHLEDLAVMVLFSVFEGIVRERVLSGIRLEQERITHPSIRQIVKSAEGGIKKGSFALVLDVFKSQHANLVEEVKQVRRYRNWVAHGGRSEQPAKVEPRTAYDRLNRFLVLVETSLK
jgi:hypothetical protein